MSELLAVFSVEEVEMLGSEPLHFVFTSGRECEPLVEELSCRLVERDHHWLRHRLHPGSQVHAGTEQVVDILLDSDERADHRPAVDPDPRLPLLRVGVVSSFQVATHPQGHPSDVLGVLRVCLGHARDRHVCIPDGPESLTSEHFGDAIESREDVVEFRNHRAWVVGDVVMDENGAVQVD